jgi:hypothetical protein
MKGTTKMPKPMSLDLLSTGLAGYGHPVRLRCLVLLEQEHSPSELCQLLSTAVDAPTLGTTAYHMRMLRQYGLIVETRTETRRGALEHFYLRTELADKLIAALAPLIGIPKRDPGRPAKGKRLAQLLRAIGAEPTLELAA